MYSSMAMRSCICAFMRSCVYAFMRFPEWYVTWLSKGTCKSVTNAFIKATFAFTLQCHRHRYVPVQRLGEAGMG